MNKLLIFILAMAAFGAWQQYQKAQPLAGVAGKNEKRGQIYFLTKEGGYAHATDGAGGASELPAPCCAARA